MFFLLRNLMFTNVFIICYYAYNLKFADTTIGHEVFSKIVAVKSISFSGGNGDTDLWWR